MAIRGSLRQAGAVDILQLLALGRKTGCLSLSDGVSFGRVYLDAGLIVHASIINRPDRLGQLLVKNGHVTDADLNAAIQEQGTSGKRIGEILVQAGKVAGEDLDRLVRLQIEESIYLLFTWTQGQFYFEPDELPGAPDARVRLHPESLLLEGARRVDEWSVIEKKISSPGMVFSVDLGQRLPAYDDLSADQRRALMLTDGIRTVAEVVAESGLLEFDGYRALYGLLQAGCIAVSGERARDPEKPSVRTVEEHRNLALAFRRTGMVAEARRELQRLIDLSPDDSHAKLRLAEIELLEGDYRAAARRAMEVARTHPESKEGFYIVALALEGAGRLEEAEATVDAALATSPVDPDLHLSKAILRTRCGDLPGGCSAFVAYEGVRDEGLQPPSAYFTYAVVAFAGDGRGDAAAHRARAGLRRYPRNAALLTNAAALAERRGEVEHAEELFRSALDVDPQLAQAKRGLAEILFSRGEYAGAALLLSDIASDSKAPAEVYHRLGEIAYRRDDRDEAVRQWELALEADPAHRRAATSLGMLRSNSTPE